MTHLMYLPNRRSIFINTSTETVSTIFRTFPLIVVHVYFNFIFMINCTAENTLMYCNENYSIHSGNSHYIFTNKISGTEVPKFYIVIWIAPPL